jgi:hypothetical protein
MKRWFWGIFAESTLTGIPYCAAKTVLTFVEYFLKFPSLRSPMVNTPLIDYLRANITHTCFLKSWVLKRIF